MSTAIIPCLAIREPLAPSERAAAMAALLAEPRVIGQEPYRDQSPALELMLPVGTPNTSGPRALSPRALGPFEP